jgi:apocytochrome f
MVNIFQPASPGNLFDNKFSNLINKIIRKSFFVFFSFSLLIGDVNFAKAYPIYAQQNYQNPREANGRIVCANCHLAEKPVEIEVPQGVLPGATVGRF